MPTDVTTQRRLIRTGTLARCGVRVHERRANAVHLRVAGDVAATLATRPIAEPGAVRYPNRWRDARVYAGHVATRHCASSAVGALTWLPGNGAIREQRNVALRAAATIQTALGRRYVVRWKDRSTALAAMANSFDLRAALGFVIAIRCKGGSSRIDARRGIRIIERGIVAMARDSKGGTVRGDRPDRVRLCRRPTEWIDGVDWQPPTS